MANKDRKVAISVAGCLCKDRSKIRPARKSSAAWKARGRRCTINQGSGRQARASFCTTSCKNLAAITCGHTSPETVIALALDHTRLKRPFHDEAAFY